MPSLKPKLKASEAEVWCYRTSLENELRLHYNELMDSLHQQFITARNFEETSYIPSTERAIPIGTYVAVWDNNRPANELRIGVLIESTDKSVQVLSWNRYKKLHIANFDIDHSRSCICMKAMCNQEIGDFVWLPSYKAMQDSLFAIARAFSLTKVKIWLANSDIQRIRCGIKGSYVENLNFIVTEQFASTVWSTKRLNKQTIRSLMHKLANRPKGSVELNEAKYTQIFSI